MADWFDLIRCEHGFGLGAAEAPSSSVNPIKVWRSTPFLGTRSTGANAALPTRNV